MVVRHLQARQVEQLFAEQQDVQVERARTPAQVADAPLFQFDGLQGVEQVERRQVGVEGRHAVDEARLVGGAERVADIERRDGDQAGLGKPLEGIEGSLDLLARFGQVAAQRHVDALDHSPLPPLPSLRGPRRRRPLLPPRRRLRGALPSSWLTRSRIMLRRSLSLTSW